MRVALMVYSFGTLEKPWVCGTAFYIFILIWSYMYISLYTHMLRPLAFTCYILDEFLFEDVFVRCICRRYEFSSPFRGVNLTYLCAMKTKLNFSNLSDGFQLFFMFNLGISRDWAYFFTCVFIHQETFTWKRGNTIGRSWLPDLQRQSLKCSEVKSCWEVINKIVPQNSWGYVIHIFVLDMCWDSLDFLVFWHGVWSEMHK